MRKKTATILIVISTIINIFAAAFIFLDLQAMQAPDTTVSMEILEINSEEAIIQTRIDISNPNSFEIIVKNLAISLHAPNGDTISILKVGGKNIPANKHKTIIGKSVVNYNGYSPEKLISKVSGVVGMKIGFIEKTLPISVKVISDLENLISNVASPTMSVKIGFGEITQKNVNLTVEVETYNPNTFNIAIEDIFINLVNDTGVRVGSLTMPKVELAANSTVIVNGSANILIEALNAKVITTNIDANVSATLAGFEKTLPFSIESKIIMPDLETLLPSAFPTDAVVRSDYRASLFGLVGEITLETRNPHNIEFAVKDMEILVYRIDRNTKRKICEGIIEDGIIEAKNITYMTGEVVLPYRKLFIPPPGGKLIPDWLEVTIRANVTIKGLNNYFWVGMIAYQDVHPLRKDKIHDSPKEVDWFTSIETT